MNGRQGKTARLRYGAQTVVVRTGVRIGKVVAESHSKLRSRAAYAVSKALRKGTLVRKPCEVCGNPRSQAHHDDYKKPLEVKWLCIVHHNLRHNSLGRGPAICDKNWRTWAILIVDHWSHKPTLTVPASWGRVEQRRHWSLLLKWLDDLKTIMNDVPWEDHSELVAELHGSLGLR